MKTDPRVDAYIAEAPTFAQPILQEVRSRVGKACPSAEETIKWNVPFFLLGDKILASMAAFKKHVKVGVWTGMMPKFVDVSELEELPASKDFAQQLQTAAEAIDGAMTSKPSKEASAESTKKAPPKKAPAKKALAVKASPKKAPAKKAAAKVPAKKAASKQPPANRPAAKKAATKKAVAKKAAAKKAAAKKSPRKSK